MASVRFPSAAGQTVRSPTQVMTERMATPLEAVLLLSSMGKAMTQQLGVRTVLLVLNQAAESAQAFILAWTLVGSARWQALDLQRAATLSFADNVQQTSEVVNDWMRGQPNVTLALETRGVFLQPHSSQVALNFAQAAQTFSIRGLP